MASSNMFSGSPHLSREQIIAYAEHKLIGKELHDVEKHLVDCSLCNDALQGLHSMSGSNILAVTDDLRRMVKKRKIIRRPLFTQLEMITVLAIVFLIVFLIIIAIVIFIK